MRFLNKYTLLLFLIILFQCLVLSKVILFPYPELFVYPYLAKSGFLPYKQIFDQHFPSILMLPVNIYDFGLRSPESARLWLIGLAAVSHVFLYLLAKKVLKNEKHALLANFIYLILSLLFEGYVLWIDSFLPPILLFGALFLIKYMEDNKVTTLAISGFFLGLALFFKQVLLPLFLFTGLYVYWVRRSVKHFLIYAIIGLTPLFLLVYWIYLKGIASEFFYWTVNFNFEVYAKMGQKLPTLSQLTRLLIYLLPAGYIAFINFRKNENVRILSFFLILTIILAVSRFEFVHLQPSLPFLVILTTIFIVKSDNLIKKLFFTLLLITTIVWSLQFYKNHIGSSVYFFDKETLLTADKVKVLTTNKDHVFVFGPYPVIYSLSDRLPSGKVFTATVPWNMYVAGDKILQAIREDPPKVVVRDRLAEIDGQKVVNFAPDIEKYINANYVLIEAVGKNEILMAKK